MLFARNFDFYHTFLLALLKKLESESKSWSKKNPNLELVRTLHDQFLIFFTVLDFLNKQQHRSS